MTGLIACPLCGSRETRLKFTKAALPVHQCGCGMIFLNPPPSADELDRLYGEHYYDSWGIAGDEESAPALMKKRTFSARLSQLPRDRRPGRVLDVGCATGFFLEVARDAGWDVRGVELSSFAASLAQKKFGDRVVNGTLEQAAFPDGFFDLVTLSDLLEHVPALDPFVAEVKRILKPGGMLMIVTPDAASFTSRLMGSRWSHYKTEHLVYFSHRTLSTLLERHGFQDISCRPAEKYLDIDYIHQQFRTYPHWLLTPLANLLARLLPAAARAKSFPVTIGEMLCLAKAPER